MTFLSFEGRYLSMVLWAFAPASQLSVTLRISDTLSDMAGFSLFSRKDNIWTMLGSLV